MLQLDPAPKVITFDCYGTLVQWGEAVQSAAQAILATRRPEADARAGASALALRLRAAALNHQQRPPYRDYRSVLRSALAEALASAGYVAEPRDEETLLTILRRIEPHPEVPATLERLRRRYRLAVISNTDDELISGTIAAIGVPIDLVVTAQQARAYKPDHQLFLFALDRLKVGKDDVMHVGMGQYTDLKACNELGVRCIWVNRENEALEAGLRTQAVVEDLSGLAELV